MEQGEGKRDSQRVQVERADLQGRFTGCTLGMHHDAHGNTWRNQNIPTYMCAEYTCIVEYRWHAQLQLPNPDSLSPSSSLRVAHRVKRTGRVTVLARINSANVACREVIRLCFRRRADPRPRTRSQGDNVLRSRGESREPRKCLFCPVCQPLSLRAERLTRHRRDISDRGSNLAIAQPTAVESQERIPPIRPGTQTTVPWCTRALERAEAKPIRFDRRPIIR